MAQNDSITAKPPLTATAAALLTMVLWASAFVAIRHIGVSVRPGPLALGRLLVGAVALLAVVTIRREGLPPRAAWPGIAGMGVFWFGLYMVALNWGEQHTDAATAALLIGTGPLLVALLAGFLLHEGFPRPLLAGLAVAFIGAALAGASSGGGDTAIVGVLLCLAAAAGHAVGVIFQKPALAHASPLLITAYSAAVGAVACLPFAGQLVTDLGNASTGAWAGVVYLGLLPTALAFWTWSYALAHMPAGRLSATTYIVPALTVVLAWPTLGEFPSGLALAGGALCLIGVGIFSRRTPRTAPGSTSSSAPESPPAESGAVDEVGIGQSTDVSGQIRSQD
ncbi:DMT family transporter [Streptomyces sp. NPDC048527]|uniref:DMT family transporter n=1 Tax=Streptomyces sp. NPDC048527 TaxID=3365568 RepID=UPI0037222C18